MKKTVKKNATGVKPKKEIIWLWILMNLDLFPVRCVSGLRARCLVGSI